MLNAGKTPELFEAKGDVVINSVKYNKQEDDQINEEELRGSFDEDQEGYLLIKENAKGILIDKNGKQVNKLGYLIDKEGNIINHKGEFIMWKEEFDDIMKDEDQKQVIQKEAFKEESPSKNVVYEMTKVEHIKEPENKDEEEKKSNVSASYASGMEDAPSNYDSLNHYQFPIEKSRQENLVTSIKKGFITNEEFPFNGQFRPHMHRKKGAINMSMKRQSNDKIFTKQKQGYDSDNDFIKEFSKDNVSFNPVNKGKDITKANVMQGKRMNTITPDVNKFEYERYPNNKHEVQSNMPDDVSASSESKSNISHLSNQASMAKIKGLESIYLQRVGSTKNAKYRSNRRRKFKRSPQ